VTHLDICRAKTKCPDLELFRLFGRTGPPQFYGPRSEIFNVSFLFLDIFPSSPTRTDHCFFAIQDHKTMSKQKKQIHK